MSYTPSIVKFTPTKNNPEHVVMAPETPSTGRRVHGKQDSERNERDSDLACTRRSGAHSRVNSFTRETGTRIDTKEEVPASGSGS